MPLLLTNHCNPAIRVFFIRTLPCESISNPIIPRPSGLCVFNFTNFYRLCYNLATFAWSDSRFHYTSGFEALAGRIISIRTSKQ